MNKRILFVDDEPHLLEGLRRTLRPMRHEWDMVFVGSGVAALDALAAQPCEVVLSDLHMPGMNGADLMAEVRRRYPQVVRLIMSGSLDQDLILQSVAPTHQFLSKPCSVEALKEMVGRACALHDLLADEALQGLVSQMQSLPSLPALYFQLTEELQAPDPSIKKIGQIISQDLGMTAKVLQLVNSAFFGIRRQISSPAEAASLLGLDTLAALILTIQVFSQFKQERLPGFSPTALWTHSLQVGLCAKRIAQVAGQATEMVQAAFTAGLLHDTGHLVLAANLPQQYARLLALVQTRRCSYDEAAYEVFGTTPSAVGAYLLGLWGLPPAIVEAVAFHHQPGRCLAQGFSPLAAVHVASALVSEGRAQPAEVCAGEFAQDYLAQAGLVERLPAWRETCAQALSKAA